MGTNDNNEFVMGTNEEASLGKERMEEAEVMGVVF
jgi:hypothetical protein